MAGAVLCVCKAGEPREDSFLRGQNGESWNSAGQGVGRMMREDEAGLRRSRQS